MGKTKVTINTGSTGEFFDRLRVRAARLDRGETLPEEITISFEDPADLLGVLTAERLRLLRQVKGRPRQLSALTAELNRNVRAISRDVSLLEQTGLVRTKYQANPGQGRLKLVEGVAERYTLTASL